MLRLPWKLTTTRFALKATARARASPTHTHAQRKLISKELRTAPFKVGFL